MADPQDGKIWDNSHKKWDGDRPFHRIGSPFFNSGQFTRADGNGASCGCRSGVNPVIKAVPAWVSVGGTRGYMMKELEGKLVRSFQTWTDFPIRQWHRWYDWNFHVEPATGSLFTPSVDGYAYLRGRGNDAGGSNSLVQGETMECEWDTGAFGTKPGPMFDADWCWPMTGQWIWLAGRWIYDCGHANNNLMRSELHPCMAVATARWEAVKFDTNSTSLWPKDVAIVPTAETLMLPAIQFMFFASRQGGYTPPNPPDWSRLGNPYKFVIDLPLVNIAGVAAPIQPTPPTNTVVVTSPTLLARFESAQFQAKGRGKFQFIQPTVTPIDPGDGTAPTQVTISIPANALNADTDCYGFVVSLGWFDVQQELAKRVYECQVSFGDVTIRSMKSPKWEMNYGVNGRWFRKALAPIHGIGDVQNLGNLVKFGVPMDLPDSQGGPVRLNAHGKSIQAVGEFFEKPESDRTIRFILPTRDATWFGDIDQPNDALADIIRDRCTVMLAGTLNNQNDPIGVTDMRILPGSNTAFRTGANALLVGRSLKEIPGLAELVFDVGEDYELLCRLTIKPQTVP